ncbi:MAG: methionine--tRNA ligase [Candidatus Thermoplasmatota archaeon]|nr:methionine--tRNA ligase [Candidatus Thermoplasmatota archaeon]
MFISLAPYLNVVSLLALGISRMNKKIYIGVAWPYANGSLHLGHIAGCYLPADIFARFQRLQENDVLMVSGSDEHGTPVTITADKEHISPQDVVDRYNTEHTKNMKDFGISFDLFTRTTTKNHTQVVQDIFSTLYEKNHIFDKEVESFYCHHCNRFLPDRYIEGTCPHCGCDQARGDQCDECGQLLDPIDLVDVRCKLCGKTPELKTTTHLFFALNHFEDRLTEWIRDKKHWKSSVLKFTQNWLKEGLHNRAITRDMTWGIPVPLDGFEEKRIYVWFDAVIGYLAASKEWAQKQGDDEKWKEWWENTDAKHYYFLAKDNIPFHSIIWPSILIGYDDQLQLPYDIPANEYLRIGGEQFSKSKGTGVWVPDIVKHFDVDAVRYYLSMNMPENKDSNWDWKDFVIKNNDELVGTYGNFIHRVVSFTEKNYGCIPEPGDFDETDNHLVHAIEETVQQVQKSLSQCKFKQGLKQIMSLAKKGNVYFNEKEPWKDIKTDKAHCATTLFVCLRMLKALSVLFASYLPFSSQKVWAMIGNSGSVHKATWNDAIEPVDIGFELVKPKPLFKKLVLDDIMVEEDPFAKLDLRVAEILEVKDHPNADKLYLAHIDIGDKGKRVIVAGLKKHYTADDLTGKKIVVITNLQPATIRGVKSTAMLLAATDCDGLVSLLDPKDASPGDEVVAEGVSPNPEEVLSFDDFQQITMIINGNGEAVYDGKTLKTESTIVNTDKPVKEGAKIQ